MVRMEAIFIIGAIAIGAGIGGGLFLLYPDMMFQNTGFSEQSGQAPDVYGGDPATTTAGSGGFAANDTNTTGIP